MLAFDVECLLLLSPPHKHTHARKSTKDALPVAGWRAAADVPTVRGCAGLRVDNDGCWIAIEAAGNRRHRVRHIAFSTEKASP